MKNKVIGNIFKIFTGTFISRIAGLLREYIVAVYFGTGKIADAFTFALTFPNLFRQILGEDMVERAFMPPFKTIHDKGDYKKAWAFLSLAFNWFFVLLLIIMTLLYLVVPLFFSAQNILPKFITDFFDFGTFDSDLALKLIFILLPFMVFIGLAAFIGSLLNFFEKNWIFAFAPVMLSIGVISGVLFLQPYFGGYAIAIGYVLGAFLQLIIQIPFILNKDFRKKHKLKYYPILSSKKVNENFDLNNDIKILKRESKTITLTAIFNKSSEVVGRILAANLVTGSISSLYYSQRLFQLPFAIISLPIVRGINPMLNKMKAQKEHKNFAQLFNKGELLYLIILFPATAFIIISAKELISIVFGYGKFDANSIKLTTIALQMYALGLLPMSLLGYYTRVLSLFNKNKYALFVAIFSAIINISLAFFFITIVKLNHQGIALASSISFLFNCLLIRRYLNKDLSKLLKESPKEKGSYLFLTYLFISQLVIIVFFYFKSDYLFYDFLNFKDSKIALIIYGIIKAVIILLSITPILLNKNIRRKIIRK